MISKIRSHIKSAIKDCSCKYKQEDNPFFKDEDLISTKSDYTYALTFGATLPEVMDGLGNVVNVPVTVRTYRQGANKKLDNFDLGFTEALTIEALVLDKLDALSASYIKGITSNGVTPSEVLDSQDIYVYTCNYNFKISYGIGD